MRPSSKRISRWHEPRAMNDSLIKSRPVHVLVKPIGPRCNLECRYCFYLEKEVLYSEGSRRSDWAMPMPVLEAFIQQYLSSQSSPTVSFAWQGGEPTLLGLDWFREALALQRKHARGRRIENTLQTNGTLLDDRWCEFLARNRFLVGLSLDGPPELHDCYRVDKNGVATFDRVMAAAALLKKHGVEFNTLTSIHRCNSGHPLEVYRFLRGIGHGFLQFIPVVERIAEGSVTDGLRLVSPESSLAATVSEWSVEPRRYGEFLCAVFDEWVRNDVGRVFVQLFDVTLAAWTGADPGLCVFQGSCGNAPALEHNGDLYSCDHYVYPRNRLGNIMQQPLASMLNSTEQFAFGRAKLDGLPRACRECPVRFVCNGECPKHRFVRDADGGRDLNYLCPDYKLFFTHVGRAMDFMAGELRARRPPANVMAWLRDGGETAGRKGRVGRNDPCPCGSGVKFKRCCGAAVQ